MSNPVKPNYTEWFENLYQYIDTTTKAERARDRIALTGPAIRTLRELSGLSVRQFAPILKVTPSYLSKVERGREMISPQLAKTLYGLSEPNIEELVKRKDGEK